jgi:hypothetical protein
VLDGKLKEHLIKIGDITEQDSQKIKIFWGKINNFSELKRGAVSLNHGDESTEPNIILERNLKTQLLRNFKLKDVSELDGSDVIIVGRVGFSPVGKAIIKTGFTKYMSFRRVKILESKNE